VAAQAALLQVWPWYKHCSYVIMDEAHMWGEQIMNFKRVCMKDLATNNQETYSLCFILIVTILMYIDTFCV
jgi:hypothetical protein